MSSPPLAAPVHHGLPNPQRLLAFTTLAMAITMAVLDGSIVNVALPTVARDLAIAPAESVWIINAFQLAVTVSLLPLSALGDSLGYRRVYWAGLAVFTVASLACALAPSLAALTLARSIQGLGAAGIMSVNIALVRFIYPSSRLGQGVGNMAVVVAVASAASPTVAAAILSVASWRWLFLVNVPIGAVALFMAARTLPATPRARRPLDPVSVVLNALTFGLFITGVDGIGDSAESLDSGRGNRRGGADRRRVRPAPAGARDAACCRSICCGARCSRSRWRRRSPPSRRRVSRLWRCRSSSRARWAAPPPRLAS